MKVSDLPLFAPGKTKCVPITGLMDCSQSFGIRTTDFIAMADNPRQRNTRERLTKATSTNGHLKKEHAAHYDVDIAVTPTGKCYKVNGHTRAMAWDEGLLEAPEIIKCNVYALSDTDVVKSFYEVFDNTGAVETNKDKIFSAYNVSLGRPPRDSMSAFWGRGTKTAIEIAINNNNSLSDGDLQNFNTSHPDFAKAIDVIESRELKFKASRFTAPALAAVFISVMRDGIAAIEFWRLHNEDAGTKSQGQIDAVEMFSRYMEAIKAAQGASEKTSIPIDVFRGNGRSENGYYAMRFLSLYQSWVEGKTFKTRTLTTSNPRKVVQDDYTIEKFNEEKITKHDLEMAV